MNKAFVALSIKAVDDGERRIEGWATTSAVDRAGDIVMPQGAKYKLPLPFLLDHDHKLVVGEVDRVEVTPKGIKFWAHIKTIAEPGEIKDLCDKAWSLVRNGLRRSVSIGFSALKYEPLPSGGLKFTQWEWLELSAVGIPANGEAQITTVKSFEEGKRYQTLALPDEAHAGAEKSASSHDSTQEKAASGRVVSVSAASGEKRQPASRKGKTMAKKSFAEQIAAFRDTRTEKSARMEEIMAEAEGQTLDEAQRAEFDELEADIAQIDEHVKRLRTLEKAQMETLRPAVGDTEEKAAESRSGIIHARPKVNLEKGTGFARYAMALAAGRGSVSDALKYVEARQKWMDETPEVAQFIKADPGTTTDATWAAPLVQPTNLASEFIELLRPATILGRIDGIRRVPFNVRIPVQTGGSTVNWVGEAAPKPVSELAFDAITLGMNKVAGIVVLTDELVRSSSPAAEQVVRNDLVAQIARFVDAQFIDPAVAAGANNPASITNGVTPVAASGTDAESLYWDLNSALAKFDDTDLGSGGITIIMRSGTARGISSLRNALGQFEFNGLSVGGGVLNGLQVITSNSVPAGVIILVKGDEILLADDGQTLLDASRDATLDLNGGTAPNFNLFQRNAIGIRAERFMTWRKRRADAVSVITGAAYGPAAPTP